MHRTQGDNYALDPNDNRVFKESAPPTTVTAGWLTSVQEEIANAIEGSGQELAVDDMSDLNNQLSLAIQSSAAYDAIITSQETFNDLWERVSANVYKIKDGIGSVYFKTPAGGFYNLSSTSSPLSDGDTWGEYQTNEASFIMFDGSCYMQLGDTPSYININASNTVVYNLDARGVGATASSITNTIHIDSSALNCKLLFPSVSGRISSTSQKIVEDGSKTAVIIGALVSSCDSTSGNIDCINNFKVIVGCQIKDLVLTGVTLVRGFSGALSITSASGCSVKNITSNNNFYAFSSIETVSSCLVENITVSAGNAIAYISNANITGCAAKIITASAEASGFYTINNISACEASNISSSGGVVSGFNRCNNISGCEAETIQYTGTSSSYKAYGFYSCDNVTGCEANTITSSANSASGFYQCNNLSGNKADTIQYTGTSSSYQAYGYYDCDRISGCEAKTIQATGSNGYAYGFHSCNNLAANIADTITAVTSSRAYGYYSCNNVSSSCSAVSVDDFDFYDVETTPFKGDSATATPYGFTEVKSAYSIGAGVTYSYTPTKSCMLFGFMSRNAGSTTTLVEVRVGNAAKTLDLKLLLPSGSSGGPSFSFPVIAGTTVYFNNVGAQAAYLTLRYMPFGTTT